MNIVISKPTDPPFGSNRLIDIIRECLTGQEYTSFKLAIAFVKSGPLLKLNNAITSWMRNGKSIDIILGIDQHGTSSEALNYCLEHLTRTSVIHTPGLFAPTFHPKIYFFEGTETAKIIIGSNNLTVGGIETNFESNVVIDINKNDDESVFNNIVDVWNELNARAVKLTRDLLEVLSSSGLVISERLMREVYKSNGNRSSNQRRLSGYGFALNGLMPASTIPEDTSKQYNNSLAAQSDPSSNSLSSATLIIQISRHDNGEIWLSKTAVNQNPDFFEFPWEGRTTPKKSANVPYPQWVPDPIIDLLVYDSDGSLINAATLYEYAMNTVYYTPKGEVRITVPPNVVRAVSKEDPYPILVMHQSNLKDRDYELQIYLPGSNIYSELDRRCVQTMPSGGKTPARRFGWI